MSLLFEEELVKEGGRCRSPGSSRSGAHLGSATSSRLPPEDESLRGLPAPIIWDSDDNPLGTRR